MLASSLGHGGLSVYDPFKAVSRQASRDGLCTLSTFLPVIVRVRFPVRRRMLCLRKDYAVVVRDRLLAGRVLKPGSAGFTDIIGLAASCVQVAGFSSTFFSGSSCTWPGSGISTVTTQESVFLPSSVVTVMAAVPLATAITLPFGQPSPPPDDPSSRSHWYLSRYQA